MSTPTGARRPCPCCANGLWSPLLDFGVVPASGTFRNRASDPVRQIALSFELCPSCGLVRQASEEAGRDYLTVDRATMNQFPSYGEAILSRLRRMAPSDASVLEIGANDGAFLEKLRGVGFSRLVGVEPSRLLAKTAEKRGFRIVNDYFNSTTVFSLMESSGAFNLIVCRHTLEHARDPLDFLRAIRACLDPAAGVALIEVPDASIIPEQTRVHELWDEHTLYLASSNLSLLVERAGMTVFDLEVRTHLDTRNLVAWCRPNGNHAIPMRQPNGCAVAMLWARLPAAWARYQKRLASTLVAAPRPLYVAGAAHPQCNFVNFASLGELVDFFIDDDPNKISRIPPVFGHPRIISTVQFERTSTQGTLVLTGFGYPNWQRRLTQHALNRGLRVLDPNQFKDLDLRRQDRSLG